jgi:hypothetical protein
MSEEKHIGNGYVFGCVMDPDTWASHVEAGTEHQACEDFLRPRIGKLKQKGFTVDEPLSATVNVRLGYQGDVVYTADVVV